MDAKRPILITGAEGLVGRSLLEVLEKSHPHIIRVTRKICDLEDRRATLQYWERMRPAYVFHLAAKVGGIRANMTDPVGFLQANALMGCHVLEACWRAQVEKTLILGSSCVYPRDCPQPMREEYLLTGPLEPTNEGYALAKIMGLKLARYYHDQFGMKVVSPMPCNIYGPGDSFDLEKSHVLSALVRRFVEAAQEKKASVTLWGTGRARREFIHVRDVARALLFFMNEIESPDLINLGSGRDVSIQELATLVAGEAGFTGKIEWDHGKPDGMPKKLLDVTKLSKLGFQAQTELGDGVREMIQIYKNEAR